MIRYVLFSDEAGVYLGSCMGLGFWSKLDSAGQTHACVFESEAQVAVMLAAWDSQPPFAMRTVAVDCADEYAASIQECATAGLPAWAP